MDILCEDCGMKVGEGSKAINGMICEDCAATPKPCEWRPDEFRDRFTDTELAEIFRLAATDDTAALIMIRFFTSPVIRSDSEALISSMNFLTSKKIISESRRKEITS